MPCVCADSVYARSSADSHVNAAGPQRSVEPAGPRPLCHTVHGHCLGKQNFTLYAFLTHRLYLGGLAAINYMWTISPYFPALSTDNCT